MRSVLFLKGDDIAFAQTRAVGTLYGKRDNIIDKKRHGVHHCSPCRSLLQRSSININHFEYPQGL